MNIPYAQYSELEKQAIALAQQQLRGTLQIVRSVDPDARVEVTHDELLIKCSSDAHADKIAELLRGL